MLPEQLFSEPVRGPAYRPLFKSITVSTVFGIAAYGIHVFGRRTDVAWPILVLLALASIIVLSTGWYILTGKTTIDAQGVRQDWLFQKSYRWGEIARARVVRMPGSVRLVLYTGNGPLKAIHSGTRELDRAFARISECYRS